MQRIQRVASGVLVPTPVTAGASHGILNLLLQWKELKTPLASQSLNPGSAITANCAKTGAGYSADLFPQLNWNHDNLKLVVVPVFSQDLHQRG